MGGKVVGGAGGDRGKEKYNKRGNKIQQKHKNRSEKEHVGPRGGRSRI